ncbi:MAG: sigma-70 family RNA polymerase sigma factor [Clostridia bacterium]|nr:sigma-70 family RNA polymerase sigma factor [Clostridia bacterium]
MRDDFIEQNIGLVHLCVKKYLGRGIEYDDLFQAGCIGLIKASERFDSERGIKFSTYAVPVILGEIRQLFRCGGSVKVGRALKELSLSAAKERQIFTDAHGREPTVCELAQILDVEPEQAALAVNASMPAVSLTDGEESGGQLEIKAEGFEQTSVDIIALRQVITELEDSDRKLIFWRYFKEKTQAQTAQIMGMTQVQVSRREKKIILLMREKMAG